ncbi:VacJ family lipoprotein [Marinobacter sp. TBZ242]|uniref:VacJ family lipoprotein n=1 Tax=Marinobacter azerbaijanicus TaxID=3050455 RepID=A0ABT7I6L6_9GAMM|nr:VacJ family lipoprotein [Marinobacter sp. TBZ242]MDL0429665.1 VacJ family lipoprotein [Marinobacter sp. TBZ242]
MRDFFSRHPVHGALFVLFLFAGGAAAQTIQPASPDMAQQRLDTPGSEVDPYEDWNRKVYRFNETIDNWFLRPVAKAYRSIVPGFADRGVTNFFNNLTELRNFANSVFQLKGESAVVAAGRFTYNTVFGLGGFIDVATMFELPERPEDFGQTLGYWGTESGPYLMLPFMGPSTPRDFGGFVTDNVLLPSAWDLAESPEVYYARALQIVDKRADLIPAEAFMSGDNYTFVRNAYLQRRAFLINDGRTVNDPFANDDDEDLMLEDF